MQCYGYRFGNKEGVRIQLLRATTNMTVGNTLFRARARGKSPSHLWASKTEADYCLVRIESRKLSKHKVLPRKGSITQHKPLVWAFKIRETKDTRRKIVPQGKMQVLSKTIGTFWKKLCWRLQTAVMDRQKVQQNIEKHSCELILTIALLESLN